MTMGQSEPLTFKNPRHQAEFDDWHEIADGWLGDCDGYEPTPAKGGTAC